MRRILGLLCMLLLAGCGSKPVTSVSSVPMGPIGPPSEMGAVGVSLEGGDDAGRDADPAKLKSAEYSILFLGNSHTSMHDIPGLVKKMIEFQFPEKKAYVRYLSVAHLDDTANSPHYRDELESGPWKFVVLQAQKISVSGKYNYSRKEAISFAKLAKEKKATVLFFSEWGLKGKPGDGDRNEVIYREIAKESGADVIAVSKAWDLALTEQPKLDLHASDGNHETAIGAFLTACTIAAKITGGDATKLAEFPYSGATAKQREFLAV